MSKSSRDLHELFGYPPSDSSSVAEAARRGFLCPFIGGPCTKNNDEQSEASDPLLRGPLGVCAVFNPGSESLYHTTVICPCRFYADNYVALRSIARQLHGDTDLPVMLYEEWSPERSDAVVLIGDGQGGEISSIAGSIDWIAAEVVTGYLRAYSAIEVQAIDITGNYRAARRAYLSGAGTIPPSGHGLNWENVNKRIIPQLIRKGMMMSDLEADGALGIGFLVDANVLDRLERRIGSPLEQETIQNLVVNSYHLGQLDTQTRRYRLEPHKTVRCSVDQLADKFRSVDDGVVSLKPAIADILNLAAEDQLF